jgi:Putative MetA-pathway of phenol degradation
MIATPRQPLVRLILAVASIVLVSPAARAQQMEPRAYSNAPLGLNFIIAGIAHSEGDVLLDPSLPVEDAHAVVDTAILGYARTLDFWGQSGTIAVALPYASLSANGSLEGQPVSAERIGFADPALHLTVNLHGAPALSMQEFAGYRQDVIVGASLLVTAPFGRYDSSKRVNIGTNRWSVKPELGVSKALGPWTLEAAAGVTFFSDNDEFAGSSVRKQDPLYAVQAHVIYNFKPGMWGALDTTYYTGGRTSVDGGLKNDLQQTWRFGATFSTALTRSSSIKFYFSSGATDRTGTDFKIVGIAWQYRWSDTH